MKNAINFNLEKHKHKFYCKNLQQKTKLSAS